MCVEINAERRRLHARLHSAGHLLDSAFSCLGMADLEPYKVHPHYFVWHEILAGIIFGKFAVFDFWKIMILHQLISIE